MTSARGGLRAFLARHRRDLLFDALLAVPAIGIAGGLLIGMKAIFDATKGSHGIAALFLTLAGLAGWLAAISVGACIEFLAWSLIVEDIEDIVWEWRDRPRNKGGNQPRRTGPADNAGEGLRRR